MTGLLRALAPFAASRLRRWVTALSVACLAFFSAGMSADAQFKVIGPAPYPPAVARQKIQTLFDKLDPGNRQQTIETLSGLLSWYRDIVDEELVAAWRKDTRANLPEVVEALADSRVAVAVIEFSWREQRPAAFDVAYAPLFGNLMTRFPESAQPFLDDLLGRTATGQHPPDLSRPEAETVCRILFDMPDIGTWRKDAQQILPHYRRVAESLLLQDARGSDQEKSYQAQRWLSDLKSDAPAVAHDQSTQRDDQQSPRRRLTQSPSAADGTPPGVLIPPVAAPRPPSDPATQPVAINSAPAHPALPAAPLSPAPPAATLAYNGAKSGTFECIGNPTPQNAEYVFRNVPLVNMHLDYDTKTWDARLAPGDGQTQRLILRNKSSGPQKKCVVHWSVIP
jgi:hypothetical protein